MSDFQDKIWVEKYRPQVIADCVLPSAIKTSAEQFVQSGKLPNLMLTGSAGTGKTTLAKALCNEMGYEWLMINGSDEGRLIETLRNKIKNFATSVSFNGSRKVVIIDEADYIPADTVQPALRSFIEEYSANCGFIFTCNFPNRIIDPIHSRCTVIHYTIPEAETLDIKKQMVQRAFYILDKEEVQYDKKVVATLMAKHFPDFRRLINELQRYGVGGVIDSGILASTTTSIDEMVQLLKANKFTDLRTWVAKNPTLEMSSLCRSLYDKAYDIFKKESIPDLVLILAEYQYKHAFVADKEINMMAMLTEIMLRCEF